MVDSRGRILSVRLLSAHREDTVPVPRKNTIMSYGPGKDNIVHSNAMNSPLAIYRHVAWKDLARYFPGSKKGIISHVPSGASPGSVKSLT